MIEETVSFDSDGRRITGCLSYPETGDAVRPVLICPPHPLLGGDAENNVVRTLSSQLSKDLFSVLRFNYGGVGESETHLDLKKQEEEFWMHQTCPEYEAQMLEDAAAAAQLLKNISGGMPAEAVIGYSFGCLPALKIFESDTGIQRLLIISPPLTKWKMDPARFKPGRESHFFYTDGDFACPEELITGLYREVPQPKTIVHMSCDSHFYIGAEEQLAESVLKTLVCPESGSTQ